MTQSDPERELLVQALDDFNKAMALRTERNVRAAKRVTVILRAGILSIVLMGSLMAAMLWAFTDRVRVIVDVVSTMRLEFKDMSDNMAKMRVTLGRIENDMTAFSVVTGEMHFTRDTVGNMNADVQAMATQMDVMTTDIDLITADVFRMNQAFRLLAPSVSRIGANVDQGSAPAKTFNSVFPFSWMMR